MAIKKKRQVEKLKAQDNALEKLPSIEKEKKVMRKGERLLEKLLVKKRIRAVKPKNRPAKGKSKKR